jgi:hypothetical protein
MASDSSHSDVSSGDTSSGDIPPRRICAVCARVLNYHEVDGWQHTRQDPDDHPVVPVLAGEVQTRSRCDFCSSEPTISFVVSEPIKMVAVADDDEQLPVSRSDSTWACCAVCDRLIRKHRWTQVSERSLRSMSAQQGGAMVSAEVAAALRQLHRVVAANVVGQPVRL